MAKRRESPISRVNPSGQKVWVARATDSRGNRRHVGTFRLKRDAQSAIHAAYDECQRQPVTRDTLGEYAADWTERRPRSERTNDDRNSKLSQVLDVEIVGRKLAIGASQSCITAMLAL